MFPELFKNLVWGFPTVAAVTAFGVYFTYKSRLYRPGVILRSLGSVFLSFKRQKSDKGISPFAAAATALGGTVGVGSIVGVGYGIAVGGAGSVFWLWVFSFFGMGIKYAEVKVSLADRTLIGGSYYGGAPYRLKKLGYKKTAAAFCVLCILCSFGTGNIAQSGAMAEFFTRRGMPALPCALLCGGVVAFAVFGGGRRISSLNAFFVPAASAIYIIACIAILIINRAQIGTAFGEIFKSAFGLRPAVGGFSGAVLSAALKEGCARSVFSNEAGMGSSPLAHATSGGDIQTQCGFGVFEIFFDTFVVSTLTALCLLSCRSTDTSDVFGMNFGSVGSYLFGLLVAVFAFASVISWCYYAECCIICLFGSKKTPRTVYRAAFSAFAALGALLPVESILAISDVLNVFMMIPNLFLLYKCRNEIKTR